MVAKKKAADKAPTKTGGNPPKKTVKKTAKRAAIKATRRASGKSTKKAQPKKSASAAKDSTANRRAGGTKTSRTSQAPRPSVSRHDMIAIAAYYRAQRRNVEGGEPVQDWLKSEKEIDEILNLM